MEYINAKEFKNNPTLEQTIEPDTDLKNIFVEYVGGKLNPELGFKTMSSPRSH